MVFSPEQIDEFAKTYETWVKRMDELNTNFLLRKYRTEMASEFAKHGLGRRLSTLHHCLDKTFRRIPPEADETPTGDNLKDAAVYIQAFVINVFGVFDNLARIWCIEADLRRPNGKAIPNSYIGLGPKNIIIRHSLSVDMQKYLETTNQWFSYLEDYRHALAHRIPLYIPPSTLNEDQAEEFNRLELEILQAIRNRDYELRSSLAVQQRELGAFQPVIMHSFGEKAKPVWFHGQLLCDLSTVVEIGERLLGELNRLET